MGKKANGAAVAEMKKQKDSEETVQALMYAAIGDPDAKPMGIAKLGGKWFKNWKTGKLYRVDTDGKGGYEVKESKQTALPEAVIKKQAQKAGVKGTAKASGPSRKELMEEAKAKKISYFRILSKEELTQILATEDEKARAKIVEGAKKRWMDCDFFKNKAVKATEKKG